MNRLGSTAVVCAGVLALAVASSPAAPSPSTERYKTILVGNPFRLKPPPVVEAKVEPPPPSDKIYLTGIATILPPARALIGRQEPGAKTVDFLSLAVGEKDGSIEVLEIDEDNGLVKIRNGGAPQILSFETDSMKAVAPTPAPGGVPGAPGAFVPGVPPVAQGYQQPQPGVVAGQTPQNTFNSRPVTPTAPTSTGGPGNFRNPVTTPSVTPSAAPADGTLRPIPSRVPRVQIGTTPQSNSVIPQPAPVDPVAQQVKMEVYRQVNPSDFPPLPPTD